MKTVVSRGIPHGQVPFVDIRDIAVRDRVMRLGENDRAIARQLAALTEAVAELQRKVRQ